MPAYLVFGPSGSGKSTLCHVLRRRGYRSIETDFEGDLSGWRNHKTREKVAAMPSLPAPAHWVDAHSWVWDADRMHALLASVGDEPVFFCGGADNEKDFYDLFEKRFGLCVDGDTLAKRLQSRDPKRWADGSAELSRVLAWNKQFKAYCVSTGAVVIDSSVSPDTIADTILHLSRVVR